MIEGAARVFGFPETVDEVSARLVAAGVVAIGVAAVALGQPWLTVVLAYGFVARVLAGPTLSPLAQLVVRVVRPKLSVAPWPVAGPPKRFAQGIGAALTVTAAVLALGFGQADAASALLVVLIAAASLEAFLGICLGCAAFGWLMRIGLVPERLCERCVVAPR